LPLAPEAATTATVLYLYCIICTASVPQRTAPGARLSISHDPQRLRPDEPVPMSIAVQLGQREIGIEGGKPGPGRGHKTGSATTRFPGGYGTVAHWLARLDRDRSASRNRVSARMVNAGNDQKPGVDP
jgi:hypothetical protein